MNIGDLPNNNDNKVHARTGKIRCISMQKNIFKSYGKFKIYFILSKSGFCPPQFTME